MIRYCINLIIPLLSIGMLFPGAVLAEPTPTTVTLAIDREYAPYEFLAPDNSSQGFTPELLRLIAVQKKWKLIIKPMAWPEAVTALKSGEVDLINMIRTPDREELYRFSLPHSTIDQSLFINQNKTIITDLKQLTGRTIALQPGDISEEKLANNESFTRQRVSSKEAGFLRLMTGQVDGFFAATQPGIGLIQKNGLQGIVPGVTNLFPLEFCFASLKKNSALIQQINEALIILRGNGNHAELVKKWLSASVSPLQWLERWAPYLILAATILAFGLAGALLWMNNLKRSVQKKTQDLSGALDALQSVKDESRLAQQRSLSMLDMSGLFVVGMDEEQHLTLVNRRLCELMSRKETELLGRKWLELPAIGGERNQLREELAKVFEDGAGSFTSTHLLSSDATLNLAWDCRLVDKSPDGRTRIICAGHDQTSQKLVEDIMHEQEDQINMLHSQFEAALHAVADPIVVLDQQRKILWCNAAAEKHRMGTDPTINLSCHQNYLGQVEDCESCIVERCLASGQPQIKQITKPDAQVYEICAYPVISEGKVIRVVEMAKNISERIRYQNELQRAGQLAAVGELASGIAHEINNPINGIINYAQILKGLCNAQEKPRSIAERIMTEADRIALIVANLLDFTRKSNKGAETLRLNEIISETLILVGTKIRNQGIEINVKIPKELPMIVASHQKLQQVLMNLLNNARDTLEEKFGEQHTGGRIDLSAKVAQKQLKLVIMDNGCGISAETMPRVKEAFFTTKDENRGTGLGLAICEDIVQEMGGRLEIESQVEHYTKISVYLPIAAEAVEPQRQSA